MANPAAVPHSLDRVSDCLQNLRAPTGPFDPRGAWEHRYSVWIVLPVSRFGKTQSMGAFRIRREPAGEDAAALDVTLAAKHGGRGAWIYRVEARLTCAVDQLATPRSWELRSLIMDPSGGIVTGTEAKETGQVSEGTIRYRRKVERTMPAPKAFTSNWSLFDALQRLPGNDVEPMTFDLLEEMSLLKPNQRLVYRQTVETELGGQRTRLHGFEQMGEAILPYCYWLDDQRRLLIAVGGRRAYIFDPSAELPEVKK